MKKLKYSIILLVIILSFVITACRTGDLETPNPENTATEVEAPSDPEITAPIEERARFLIKAEPELIEPVTVLYEAFFNGESPSFVQEDPDLLVTPPVEIKDFHGEIPAVFLTDGAMYPQNDSEELEAFIQFAVSADGQQVLINAGLLPESLDLADQSGNMMSINLPVRRVLSTYGPVTAMIYSVNAEDRLVSASYLGARDPLGSSVMEKMDSRFPGIQ
ncbi:MAG: hypothetical protein SVO01_13595, partial [Thermotogota bacterium]|nr:hypothetical protein [Thermotogota bacterium]